MVYISADSSIAKKRPNNIIYPFKYLSDVFLGLKPQWQAVALAYLAFACKRKSAGDWKHPSGCSESGSTLGKDLEG
jgi:hypothetical protein